MQSRPRVALLIETSNAYARDLLYGIRSYVREQASWSIYLTEHGRGETLPEWIHKWEGEGIIARVENQTIANALLKTGTPTVDVSFGLERSPFPRVATDSNAASRLAVEHLRERGFRDFGYCGDARYHWSNMRQRHFSEHLRTRAFRATCFTNSAQKIRSPGNAPSRTSRVG